MLIPLIEADRTGAPAHQGRIDHVYATEARVDGHRLVAGEEQSRQPNDEQQHAQEKACKGVLFDAVKAAKADHQNRAHHRAAHRGDELQGRPAAGNPGSHSHSFDAQTWPVGMTIGEPSVKG